jgi:ethanolamine ammonia-lyase small subunit
MGLDVCATFHMGIPPATLRSITKRIVTDAAPAYLMAVAGNADPMLGYLTTSFREHPALRRSASRQITPSMRRRLAESDNLSVARFYADYQKAGGDRRSTATLEDEARLRIQELQERGFDLELSAAQSDSRVDRLYEHARAALYSTIDAGVIADACPQSITVRTRSESRDQYLNHPEAGERLRAKDAARLRGAVRSAPEIQLVISDGLNANAVNEQLRALIPPLRRLLIEQGHRLAEPAIVVHNGRVRVGYQVGGLVDALVVIHVIGERPGTGLNTVSAYITYGRDQDGASRWSPALDHAMTTAICGIHPRGKAPEIAVVDISRTTRLILATRRSGVALQSTTAASRPRTAS